MKRAILYPAYEIPNLAGLRQGAHKEEVLIVLISMCMVVVWR